MDKVMIVGFILDENNNQSHHHLMNMHPVITYTHIDCFDFDVMSKVERNVILFL